MERLTIYKAKSEYDELKNQIEFKLDQKKLNFERTQPSATDIKDISVQKTIVNNDNFAMYVARSEELDKDIDELQKEADILLKYIKKELKRIDEYDEWEQKVIYLRMEHKTWFQIAMKTPFSERTCKRIWAKYKNNEK